MEFLSSYQYRVIESINKVEQSKIKPKFFPESFVDMLYSLINNPARFNDYKVIVRHFSNQPLILQKYLLDSKFIYGENEQIRNIIMSTLFKNYKNKYLNDPPFQQPLTYKGYFYILNKPLQISDEPEIYVVPLSIIIQLILSSESRKEFMSKYYVEQDKLKEIINSPHDSPTKYLIPQNSPIYENIMKILSKGYRRSWCLLIEYIVNNAQFLKNAHSIPKNYKYRDENIGLVYDNLSKQLPENSQYRPFKYDFIELINLLGLKFNININDLISATPFRKPNSNTNLLSL